MNGVQFNLNRNVSYERLEQVTPMVRRVLAKNPSPFTFTGTSTFIIGQGNVAIVDPGPLDADHVEAICNGLEGERVTHVLITHTHGDHSPATRLLAKHFDFTTYGFGPHPIRPEHLGLSAATELPAQQASDNKTAKLQGKMPNSSACTKAASTSQSYDSHGAHDFSFVPDVAVSEGQISGAGWSCEVLHTPGHISNHLCFSLQEESLLFSGDHVMGWSTTIIPAPDGNLNEYMASMELISKRSEKLYLPTHGSPIENPQKHVRDLMQHRLNRSSQIIDCLKAKPCTIKEIVELIYTHIGAELKPAASLSVYSHILALHEQKTIACIDQTPQLNSTYRLNI